MAWHLSVEVDRSSATSLAGQLQDALRHRITDGVLRPGTRLPSTRRLADDLGVSRSVAVEAYEQLAAEGWLTGRHGSGTCVSERAGGTDSTAPPPAVALREPEPAAPVRWDLRTGRADPGNFPRQEWLASYRTVLAAAGREELDYPPVAGHPSLRRALADYLGRVRGVRTEAGSVMVTAGFAQGLSLLCEALPRLGIRTLAVEDPGHRSQRRFIEECGMRVVPVRVDHEGIDVGELAASGARAVLVTPAHQYPTGVVLSSARRQALVRWARESDGLVVEDDYDGEFWFDREVRPAALQELAPEHVVYAGTASKALVPGLRIGWLAVPPPLTAALDRVRSRRDLGTDGLTQCAFAELITSGLLDRHLRRVRARYRRRREAFTRAAAELLPEATLLGVSAGLHGYLQLPPTTDESALTSAALTRSVLVHGGAPPPGHPGPPSPRPGDRLRPPSARRHHRRPDRAPRRPRRAASGGHSGGARNCAQGHGTTCNWLTCPDLALGRLPDSRSSSRPWGRCPAERQSVSPPSPPGRTR
ncbi:PLP-dependent aminotransferase family protein [Kitasatospora albolonga]|uniref:MocR-like pyridoxine biosynthesis transcription factor PdxR n=1 Tax=Kitasatospora albolonga TaxID=68173 RepID=UPI0031E998CE